MKPRSDWFNATFVTFTFGLVAIIILINVASAILPSAQDAGDQLNATNQCNAVSGCLYNATVDADNPCRSSANQSNTCSEGQPTVPLSTLFGGSGVVFLIIMATLFLAVARYQWKK